MAGSDAFGLGAAAGSPALRRRRVAALLLQVARAVEGIHAEGRAHGNLNPQSILVDRQGKPQVPGPCDPASLPEPEARCIPHPQGGWACYLAPEVAAGQPDSLASDVYALGTVAYELLNGEPPVRAGSPRQALQACAPPALGTGQNSDADLEDVVARCLAADPAGRFAGAGALAEALEDWLGLASLEAAFRDPGSTALRPSPVVLVGLVLLLALALATAWLWWQAQRRTANPPAAPPTSVRD